MKTFEDVLSDIGDFGTYQKRLYAFCILPSVFNSAVTFITVFILNEHPHRCYHPSVSNNATFDIAYSANDILASKCHIHSYNETVNVTSQTKCTTWVYDTEQSWRTPISDFDLVCDRVMLRSHSNMAFFGGTLAGVVIVGLLGDVLGRKPLMISGLLLLMVSTLACAFSYNYEMFLTTRFFAGISTLVSFTPAFVISMEIVGPSKRVFVGVIVHVAWCIGELILCLLANFIRNWRTLQLVIAIPSVLFLSYIIIIPESPRWLLLVGRKKQAMNILRRVAKVNGTRLPVEVMDISYNSSSRSLKDLLAMLKTPTLLLRWTIISFIWFGTSVAYFGLTLNAGKIGGNLYINFTVSAIVEAMGFISCIFINDRFGRKAMNCGSLVLTGLSCLFTNLPAQLADESLTWLTITLFMIGKFAVSAAFGNIFIYTSELFPTSSRSFILASSNVWGRVGSLISPYIADLSILVSSMFGKALPLIVFGSLGLSAGLMSIALPETLNVRLPDTMADIMDDNRPESTLTRRYPEDEDNIVKLPIRSM